MLVTRISAGVDALNQDGRRAGCENLEARGYPFRIGVFCDSVMYEDATGGVGFRARAFRSAAQVYSPLHIIGELDGPARVEAPGFSAFELDWAGMRASVRLTSALPERVSVEGTEVNIRLGDPDSAATEFGTVETGEVHLRPAGDDLDIAVRFSGLMLGEALLEGRDLPVLDGLLDMTVADGAWFPNSEMGPLRGKSGTIRTLTLSTGTTAGVTANGPIAIDEAGLIDAQLQLKVRNPEALAKLLGDLLPESRDEIEMGFTAISAMGETPTLPLRIVKSEFSLCILPLGSIPPL